jgi:hypothetical protein
MGVHYVNTGDWVESCTAVVETPEGELQIVKWSEAPEKRPKLRLGRLREREAGE